MLWIPAGFAHGFCVLSEFAEVLYKATDYYAPSTSAASSGTIRNFTSIWPSPAALPPLSAKDAAGTRLRDAEVFQ